MNAERMLRELRAYEAEVAQEIGAGVGGASMGPRPK